MQINTSNSELVSQKLCPIAMKHYNWVKNKINKVSDAKVIHSSHSSWSAPIVIIPKADCGKCLVIDYRVPNKVTQNRVLNKVTQKFIWSIPKFKDIFSKINGAKCFSTLDFKIAYYHIPLNDTLISKIAFTSPFGKYKCLKVPIGLERPAAYFQELMNKVLKDLPFTVVYNLDHLQQVFHKFWNARLSMKLSKCYFFAKKI